MITIKNLHKAFGTKKVLQGVNLEIEKGKTTAIFGVSGGGKSTIIKHIVRLLEPDQGEIWVDGINVPAATEAELYKVRKQVGFLFQSGALFDSMNVADNVAFPLVEHTKLGKRERDKKVERCLELVGLNPQEVKALSPHELSGGMRKRVGLARTIVNNPEVVLYDEPTSGLDPVTSDLISQMIINLKNEIGVTSVLISHDLNETYKCSDTIAMLFQGEIVEVADTATFRESGHPAVRQFIEGRSEGPIQFGVRE